MSFRDLRLPKSNTLLAAAVGTTGGGGLVLASGFVSPLLAGLAIAGAVIGVVMLLSPGMAFLLTTAVVPLERIGRMTSDNNAYTVSLMRIFGVLALGSFLLHTMVRKRQLKFGKAFLLYTAYTVVGFATLLYTTDRLGSTRAASAILGNLMFFFLIINVARSYRLVKLSIIVWLVATVLIGLFTMYQWHAGAGAGELALGSTSERFATVLEDTSEWQDLETIGRATGPTSHAAVYGINLVMTLPFFAFLFKSHADKRVRAAAAFGAAVVLYNIFLANTRAIVIITGLLIVLFFARGMLRIRPVTVVALVLLGAVVAAFAPKAVYERVLNPENYTYKQSGTLRVRFGLWGVGVDVAKDKWLTGTGIGNQALVPLYIKEPVPERISLHCEYLETLVEVGIFGSLFFFSFLGLMMRRATQAARLFRRVRQTQEQYWFMVACQLTMLAVLIDGVQVDVFHFPLKGWWLVAGLTWVMWEHARSAYAQAVQTAQVAP